MTCQSLFDTDSTTSISICPRGGEKKTEAEISEPELRARFIPTKLILEGRICHNVNPYSTQGGLNPLAVGIMQLLHRILSLLKQPIPNSPLVHLTSLHKQLFLSVAMFQVYGYVLSILMV